MNIKNYEINVDKLIQEKYKNWLLYKMSLIYKSIVKHQSYQHIKKLEKQLRSYHNKIALLEKNLIHKDFLKICS